MQRLLVILAVLLTMLAPSPASAQSSDDSAESELAERHAPIVYVGAQDEWCDTDGESFEPAPVDIVLDNPEVFLRQVGNGDPVAMRGPGAADVFELGSGWYLDFPGDALEPGCTFEHDARKFTAGRRSVVYAHVATQADRPDMLGLQYWLFWYHNTAKNNHEGDWEFVQLLFDVGTAEEALETDPIAIGFAQHEGGESSDWTDEKLEREGPRPVVYAARGSHASYFDQALYLGRSGAEGFGCDNTDAPVRRVDPQAILLPNEVTDPSDPYAWLSFEGRWGQRESGFFNGPTGPAAKARWYEPIRWHEQLRDSSVVIPGGDEYGNRVLTTFCTVVEQGSTLLTRAVRSPAIALAALAAALYVVVSFGRNTTWSPVVTQPLRHDRAMGQILRAAIAHWSRHPRVMLRLGLVAVPVSVIVSLVGLVVLQVPFVDDLVTLAGSRSGTSLMISLFVSGFGSVVTFIIVSAAMVTHVLAVGQGSEQRSRDPLDLYRPVLDSWRQLLSASMRAAVIVVVLFISIIGIPAALRQIVRYQVTPHVVMAERLGGRSALERSAALIRGHWWWTASLVAFIHLTIGSLATLFALMVLVAVPSIPIWLFNLFTSVVFVMTVPLGATIMAYLYGNLAAQQERPTSHIEPTEGERVVMS